MGDILKVIYLMKRIKIRKNSNTVYIDNTDINYDLLNEKKFLNKKRIFDYEIYILTKKYSKIIEEMKNNIF